VGIITSDMRAIVDSAHLCFAATVTPDGRPNLSPKGTIRVWDDNRLFFLDIASPGTRANLTHTPYIEVNVVEERSRRGYRFFGRASLHTDDEVFAEAMQRVFAEEKRQGLTTEQLKQAWEGDQRPQVERLTQALKASLPNLHIEVLGTRATVAYGPGGNVELIQEQGTWRIEDF